MCLLHPSHPIFSIKGMLSPLTHTVLVEVSLDIHMGVRMCDHRQCPTSLRIPTRRRTTTHETLDIQDRLAEGDTQFSSSSSIPTAKGSQCTRTNRTRPFTATSLSSEDQKIHQQNRCHKMFPMCLDPEQ